MYLILKAQQQPFEVVYVHDTDDEEALRVGGLGLQSFVSTKENSSKGQGTYVIAFKLIIYFYCVLSDNTINASNSKQSFETGCGGILII